MLRFGLSERAPLGSALARCLQFTGLLAILSIAAACTSGEDTGEAAADAASDAEKERPMGLTVQSNDVAPGYVLYSPLSSGRTFLVDTDAQIVHTWDSDFAPHSLYLLEDGRLLRPGRDPDASGFQAGGAMGLVEMFSWEGERLWYWKLSDDRQILHHDIEPLPNGNFLAIGWELIEPDEARAAGRREDLLPEEGLWSEFVIEVEPVFPDEAKIVWKWRIWDHLVQDLHPTLANYGNPRAHPHRLDINAGGPPMVIDEEQLEQLRAIGYIPTAEEEAAAKAATEAASEAAEDGDEEEEDNLRPDFLHMNAVDWHPKLDQIAITAPELGEFWIIRRPTSTEEAAGPAGDLLYRWGNPSAYGLGPEESKRLFYPHDVQWIPEGYENAGQITIFNNGSGRPEGKWTSIEQLDPPLQDDGTYAREKTEPWGPADVTWHYEAEDRESFFAPFISGAHRMPNGNTFVTSGPEGRVFEVDAEGRTVWELWNPWGGDVRRPNRFGDNPEESQRRFAYSIWRAEKLNPDFPGLAGRELTPLSPQPEYFVLPPRPDKEEEPEGEEEEAPESEDEAEAEAETSDA